MKYFAILLTAALLFTQVACSQPKSDAPTPPPATQAAKAPDAKAPETKAPETNEASMDLTLNDEEKAKADELVSQMKNGLFPYQEKKKKENAKIFLYLAKEGKDTSVKAAALEAMKNCFTRYDKSKTQELVNDQYLEIVRTALKSDDPIILARALRAAKLSVQGKEPDQKTGDILVEIIETNDNPAAREKAVDALRDYQDFQKDEKMSGAMLKALNDKEPYVVSMALFGLWLRTYDLQNSDKFLEKCRELMKDKDPGVRGRSAQLAAKLASKSENKEEVIKEIQGLLKDKNAFTRSAAAYSLGDLKDLPSVHLIIKMVDDKEKNTYDIRFKNLLGKNDSIHHDGSPWSRVDDAAIRAIQTLSYGLDTDNRFKMGDIDWKKIDKDMAREVKRVKEWYEKTKDKIPQK